MRRPVSVKFVILTLGVVSIAVLAVLSLTFGAREVSFEAVIAGLQGHTTTIDEAAVVARIPRTVLALLVGAALAISGVSMQAVTRNPIADPSILGVTTGAALAIVIGLVFFGITAPYGQIGLAIVGGMIAAVLVYSVGSLGRGGATPLKLALAGAATSAALASLATAVVLPRVDLLSHYQGWQIGGVGGVDWGRVATMTPVLVIGAIICFLSARGMNSLALGDELATGLGENVFRTRLLSAFGAVLLAAAATAIAGPIGFVGLIIPHLMRLLTGTDHRWLLPISALAGAALLVGADILGRVISPRGDEIPVGILTAIIGAPFFIWIVRRQKLREL